MKAKTLGIVAVVVVVLGSVVWLVTKPANKAPDAQEVQTEIAPSDGYGTNDYPVPVEDTSAPDSSGAAVTADPGASETSEVEAPAGAPVESPEGDDLGN